ncbi:MAG: PIN domain-containing protein [Puniceicoccaceae bacterium]|nr:MAG: PIN domain-containing protein [Puniceicoccaceae bacterium]
MIVVDAGVIVACVCEHPRHQAALALQESDPDWLAPPLWKSEVRNVIGLKLCSMARLITAEEAFEAYEDALAILAPGTREVNPVQCLKTVLRYGVSGYDAEYATLAQAEGVDMVTTDQRLVNRLKTKGFSGVRLLGQALR